MCYGFGDMRIMLKFANNKNVIRNNFKTPYKAKRQHIFYVIVILIFPVFSIKFKASTLLFDKIIFIQEHNV